MAPLVEPLARVLAEEGVDSTLCWRLHNTFLDFQLWRGEEAPAESRRRRSRSADCWRAPKQLEPPEVPRTPSSWRVCETSQHFNCRSGLSVWCQSRPPVLEALDDDADKARPTLSETTANSAAPTTESGGSDGEETTAANDVGAKRGAGDSVVVRFGIAGEIPVCTVTTVMLRNIACRYSQEEVADILVEKGLAGKFDLVYLPRSPTRQSNLGYAFVNFLKPEYVEEARMLLDGQQFGRSRTAKRCQVALAHVQGAVSVSQRVRRKGARKNQAPPLVCAARDEAQGEEVAGCAEATALAHQ